jgi:hypothetical protein
MRSTAWAGRTAELVSDTKIVMQDPALALVEEMRAIVAGMGLNIERIEDKAARGAALHAQALSRAWLQRNLIWLVTGGFGLLLAGGACGFLAYPHVMLTCNETVCYQYR